MTIHINAKPLKVTANGTTPVKTPLPFPDFNRDGVEIYNSDPTNIMFVKMGTDADVTAAPADNTCQWIGPNSTRVLRKDPHVGFLSTVHAAASTATVYINPTQGFTSLQ